MVNAKGPEDRIGGVGAKRPGGYAAGLITPLATIPFFKPSAYNSYNHGYGHALLFYSNLLLQ